MAAGSCSGEEQDSGKMSTHTHTKSYRKAAGTVKGWYQKGTEFDSDSFSWQCCHSFFVQISGWGVSAVTGEKVKKK